MKTLQILLILALFTLLCEAPVLSQSGTPTQAQTATLPPVPLGLSDEFALNPLKISQWQGFLKRNGIRSPELTLERVIERIRPWLKG